MIKIRICEEKLVEPILKNEVKCPVHLYTGEEAVATGVCKCLSTEDYIFGTHRSHGHYLAKGGDINTLIAEIFGKETGCSRGRGGSMHLIDMENGIIGAAPIVAGTISLSVGAALSSQLLNEGRVSVCFFGDGATGEGVLFESMNFASLHKLPVIFICENNLYSTHMPIEECRPNKHVVGIAEPFNICSYQIDGNDVLKVYETTLEAVEYCKKSSGPCFIECLTYRLRGHVGPDDNIQGNRTDIRPQEEIERWRKNDPIEKFQKYLYSNSILTKSDINRIETEIEKEVFDAFTFAKNSPYPKENELSRYVYK
jgi:pyruvate dehydrogenase E1 component alpha subunit